MKKFTTVTFFEPLKLKEPAGFEHIKDASGKDKQFKTRAACEQFCHKNKCLYVEHKFIFYR